MELKPCNTSPGSCEGFRSNRTFMELKRNCQAVGRDVARSSNRTFMELKHFRFAGLGTR